MLGRSLDDTHWLYTKDGNFLCMATSRYHDKDQQTLSFSNEKGLHLQVESSKHSPNVHTQNFYSNKLQNWWYPNLIASSHSALYMLLTIAMPLLLPHTPQLLSIKTTLQKEEIMPTTGESKRKDQNS